MICLPCEELWMYLMDVLNIENRMSRGPVPLLYSTMYHVVLITAFVKILFKGALNWVHVLSNVGISMT